jgi:hypothetical protein
MLSNYRGHAARLIFAVSLLVTNHAFAEGLPEGITVKPIAEYASRIPALEKVRLVKVVMKPGAKFDNILIKNEEYCRLSQGTLTRTIHTTGITQVITVGAMWAPPKGDRHTVTSIGDVDAHMWVYQLIEKGSSESKM